MLAFLLSLVNPLGKIAENIAVAKTKALDAKTEKARIEADVVVNQLEAHQAVLIAEQGARVTRWIRPMFALPFIIYNFKIIVWDKVMGLGSTDGLSPELIQLQMIIFGAYFLTRPFEKRR